METTRKGHSFKSNLYVSVEAPGEEWPGVGVGDSWMRGGVVGEVM